MLSTSGFVHDVMFPLNAVIEAESKTTYIVMFQSSSGRWRHRRRRLLACWSRKSETYNAFSSRLKNEITAIGREGTQYIRTFSQDLVVVEGNPDPWIP